MSLLDLKINNGTLTRTYDYTDTPGTHVLVLSGNSNTVTQTLFIDAGSQSISIGILNLGSATQTTTPSTTASTSAITSYLYAFGEKIGATSLGSNYLPKAVSPSGLLQNSIISDDGANANIAGNLKISGAQVLGPRQTGWTALSGTAVKDGSTVNADTITATDANVQKLAKLVKALTDAIITHGAIGT